jgi:hypothetical protein
MFLAYIACCRADSCSPVPIQHNRFCYDRLSSLMKTPEVTQQLQKLHACFGMRLSIFLHTVAELTPVRFCLSCNATGSAMTGCRH